ncbi:MAG: hypothetical protein RIR34_1277 [Actinomycetota bacterium]|jgi:hypothetical protein
MTKEAPETTAKSTKPKRFSRRAWIISSAAVLVAGIGIGSVVYYGSVTLPAANKASDTKACEIFAMGFTQARMGFLEEAQNKDHKPSLATAVEAYMKPTIASNHASFKRANPNGDVGKAIADLGIAAVSFQNSYDAKNPTFPSAVDQAAQNVDALCTPLLTEAEKAITK